MHLTCWTIVLILILAFLIEAWKEVVEFEAPSLIFKIAAVKNDWIRFAPRRLRLQPVLIIWFYYLK